MPGDEDPKTSDDEEDGGGGGASERLLAGVRESSPMKGDGPPPGSSAMTGEGDKPLFLPPDGKGTKRDKKGRLRQRSGDAYEDNLYGKYKQKRDEFGDYYYNKRRDYDESEKAHEQALGTFMNLGRQAPGVALGGAATATAMGAMGGGRKSRRKSRRKRRTRKRVSHKSRSRRRRSRRRRSRRNR